MYDSKVVRRRRAVLAVFVVLSIAILTAYFGESGGGFFHTLQRGAQEGVAPIETGASRALKPARDFVGWIGDTVDAKDQNADLKNEVQDLRGRLAKAETDLRDANQLKALASLHDENYFPQSTAPVTAYPNLISRSRTVWPPSSATPASRSASTPPLKIKRIVSASRSSSGKPAIASAVSGRPPMA